MTVGPTFVVRNSVVVSIGGKFATDTADESRVQFAMACRRLPAFEVGVREKRARAILLDVVEAWSDVQLPDGSPAPFDRAALKHLLRYRGLPSLAYVNYVARMRSPESNLIECARRLVAGLDGDDAAMADAIETRAQGIRGAVHFRECVDLTNTVFIWPEHEHAVRVFASLVACRARECAEGRPTSMDAIAGLLVRSVPASYAPKLLGYLQVMSAAIGAESAAATEQIQ